MARFGGSGGRKDLEQRRPKGWGQPRRGVPLGVVSAMQVESEWKPHKIDNGIENGQDYFAMLLHYTNNCEEIANDQQE